MTGLTGWRANAVKALQNARATLPDGSMLADDIDALLSASPLTYMNPAKGWGKATIAEAVHTLESRVRELELTLECLACWDRECVENRPRTMHAHKPDGRVLFWLDSEAAHRDNEGV